jgi:hypothetical protein
MLTEGNILSIFVDPPINTYLELTTLSDTASCTVGPASGFFLPNSTFLRDFGAIFTGVEYVTNVGPCNKWSFVVPDSTQASVTWFFDQSNTLTRWDMWSFVDKFVVQTFFTNMQVSSSPLPAAVFAGIGHCPSRESL